MRLKNAIKLVFANFGVAYKLLLYKTIIIAVLGGLGALIIMPNFFDIVRASQFDKVISSGWNVIQSIFNANAEGGIDAARTLFTEHFNFFTAYMSKNIGWLYGAIAIVAVLYFVGMFLTTLGDFAVGESINDHMSSLAHRGFTQSLFKNLGKASVFALVDLAVALVFHAAAGGLCSLIFFVGFDYIGILSVFLVVLLCVLANALRKTFMSNFMTGIIADGKSISVSFKDSIHLKRKDFGKLYSNYFSINMCLLCMNIGFAICTFFTGLILTLPLSTLITLCFKFVSYYTLTGKKFYISYDEIITPQSSLVEIEMVKDIED